MKHCTNCDIFTPDIETQCPKCGGAIVALLSTAAAPQPAAKPKGNDNAIGCLILIGVLVCILAFTNWLDGNKPKTDAATGLPERPCLELTSHGANDSAGFGQHIRGVVQNHCDTQYRYVEIEFKLYDSQHSVVGTAMTNVTSLGPHENWAFDAVSLHTFRRYELDHIRGW